jgi:hypothetical protein
MAIGREGNAVDVLLVALERARRAAIKWPKPCRGVPARGGERLAVGRDRKADDGSGMTLQHGLRLVLAGLPEGDAAVLAGRGHAPVFQNGSRVDRSLVEAEHLFSRAGHERP